MQNRSVDILSVPTEQYQLCTGMIIGDNEGDEVPKPKLKPEATSIPELRQHLLSLPAQTNFRALHHHVFETLPDIVVRIQRILEKFYKDDEDYNRMRGYFARKLLTLHGTVDSLADSLLVDNVIVPWNSKNTEMTIKPVCKTIFMIFSIVSLSIRRSASHSVRTASQPAVLAWALI